MKQIPQQNPTEKFSAIRQSLAGWVTTLLAHWRTQRPLTVGIAMPKFIPAVSLQLQSGESFYFRFETFINISLYW